MSTDWSCPFCFLVNKTNQKRCDACHKSRPSFGVSPKNKKKRRKHKGKKQHSNENSVEPQNIPSQHSPHPIPRTNTVYRQSPRDHNTYNSQKASTKLSSNNNANPWKHPYRNSGARSYQSKHNKRGSKPQKRVQVTLSNQDKFKTEDNLRRNYSEQQFVHNIDEERKSNYSNDRYSNINYHTSPHSHQGNTSSHSYQGSTSPQRVYKPRRSPPPMSPNNTRNMDHLNTKQQNVDKVSYGSYYDEDERYRKNGYRVGDEVYFRGRKCGVICINALLYTVRCYDDNTEQTTEKMYLSWKPDIYNDELPVSETLRNMKINWRYDDNDDEDVFYGPQRDQ